MKGYWIYKALNEKNEVLYVGLTQDYRKRMMAHERESKWWNDSKYIYVADAHNKTGMLLYEQYYINKYNPPYNKKDKRNDNVEGLNGLKELFFNYEYKNDLRLKYDYGLAEFCKNLFLNHFEYKSYYIDEHSLTIKIKEKNYHADAFNRCADKYEECSDKFDKLLDRLLRKYIYEGKTIVHEMSALSFITSFNINEVQYNLSTFYSDDYIDVIKIPSNKALKRRKNMVDLEFENPPNEEFDMVMDFILNTDLEKNILLNAIGVVEFGYKKGGEIKRAKQRMRFNKSAITRMASKAFEEGIHHKDTTGKLHKYLDKVYLMEHNSNNMRVYGEFLYLFNDNVLITVYTLNNKLKKLLKGSE